MSNYNITNVKDLPQLEQILAGNYLIVENNVGTNKLDFADFVIGPTNTSFYSSLVSELLYLSANIIDENSSLTAVSSDFLSFKSSYIPALTSIPNIITNVSTLCDVIDRYENSYVKRGLFTIPANQTSGGFTVSYNYIIDVTNADVSIAPYNFVPPGFTYSHSITSKVFPEDTNTSIINISLSTGSMLSNVDRLFTYRVNAYENFS